MSGAMSDSHPETLTDPEHSDQAGMASSPPQSGDEVRLAEVTKEPRSARKSKLFNKVRYEISKMALHATRIQRDSTFMEILF